MADSSANREPANHLRKGEQRMPDCPICRSAVEMGRSPFSCPRCGDFEYASGMDWVEQPDHQVRLSGWGREQNAAGAVPVIKREILPRSLQFGKSSVGDYGRNAISRFLKSSRSSACPSSSPQQLKRYDVIIDRPGQQRPGPVVKRWSAVINHTEQAVGHRKRLSSTGMAIYKGTWHRKARWSRLPFTEVGAAAVCLEQSFDRTA